ncbi:MAG TPA: hypothetical protein VL972_06185 [Solirubrobacteraceae bacterium]|nr:hypothetical protein [Solirubrobacteraceae bacterium]
MGSTVENHLRARVLCALVAAGLCLALAPAAALAAAPEFKWKGEGATSEKQWEVAANWVGGVAPEEGKTVQLVFPELSASACTSNPETKACYHSENNELTLATEKLTIDDGDDYVLTGTEELELGKGGLTAAPEGHTSGARDELTMPVELTEPQTWHITGASAGDNGVLLEDQVSEAGEAAGGLHIVQSKESALVFGPKAEVELGPVTIEGEEAGKAGFENGTVELQGSELNWWYEQPVTLKHVAFAGYGKVGELSTEDAELRIGSGEHLGLEASEVKLDSSSKVAFQITGSRATPGKDYSQLESEGETELEGAQLEIDVASPGAGKPCPTLKSGEEYTLIDAEQFGSVSGEFGNAPEGAEVPIHYGAGCSGAATMTIHYHEGAVTATANVPDLSLTVNVTGSGKVSSNPAGIDECTSAGGAKCEAKFEEGSTVTLTAKPESEYVFAGWIGCKKAGVEKCEISLSAASEVTAVFLEKGKEGPTGKEGKEGKAGGKGEPGTEGKEGKAGAGGANGKEGPPGKVQVVTCTTTKVKGKTKKKCTTKTVSGTVKFTTSSERATLSRHGAVFAAGVASGGRGGLRLRLHALRKLKAGRYTLTLTSGSGHHEHTRAETFTLS